MDGTLKYAEHKLDEAIRQGKPDETIAYWRGYRDCAKSVERNITDLLARAETAELERDQLREAMRPNCLLCDSMHPDNGNCTAVGGFCTAVPAAHCPLIPRLLERAEAAEAAQETLQKAMAEYKDRAENAERERNAAVSDISKILGEIDEIREEIEPEDIYDALSVVCRGYCSQSGNMCYAVENGYECKNFKWRGQKEE